MLIDIEIVQAKKKFHINGYWVYSGGKVVRGTTEDNWLDPKHQAVTKALRALEDALLDL